MKEQGHHRDIARQQKIEKVKHEEMLNERENQQERNRYNEERFKKIQKDAEDQQKMAGLAKKKLDKELELKELHSKKRAELNQKEIDTCLAQLENIN